jgi:AraC-like DNA-binding protein
MINEESPAVMKFKLSQKLETTIETSDELPRRYQSYQIKDAVIEFTEGPFGVYFTQEIKDRYWIINWLNLFIKQPLRLFSVTNQPMVALHCTLRGNISCKLEGYGKLALQKNKYGFYYAPPDSNSTADFIAEDYDAVYISFSPVYLAELIDQHPYFKELYISQQYHSPEGNVLPSFTIGPDELNILEAIKHCKLHGPVRNFFLRAKVYELIVKYFTALEFAELNGEPVNEQENRFREMESYIRQNYHLPLSIQALSRQAGMNIRSFEKGFRKIFGFPPREYIELRRLTEASELLAKTNMPVNSISHQVGFTGSNYFAVVFRKHYHCTPRQFRQQYNERNSG